MSYEIRTAILDPKTGYNKTANIYKNFRKHLNSFDQGIFLKFMPRDLSNLDILDLGSGDGRIYHFFAQESLWSYTTCDIADKLLANHPNTTSNWKSIDKVICNLENPLPFEGTKFDIILSFFVLEHIQNLEQLFGEVYRIMKPWARWIIWHFQQRKAYKYKIHNEDFKIQRYTYSKDDIIKLAEYAFFEVFVEEIKEHNNYLWDIFVLKKS